MGNSAPSQITYGYRIIKIAPGSPAQKAGLTEFLDYIIDISGPSDQSHFSGNYGEFFKMVQHNEDKQATMKVYNILYRKTRIVSIVPTKKWENSDSLLGALVRYEEYTQAHERVLRVTEVHPNSPASIAGLEPETDYILGSPQYLYTDLNELADFIAMTQEKETIKSLELYVFSAVTRSVRSTLIIPNKNWGGSGLLGCEFSLGILNHLPIYEDSMPDFFSSNLNDTAQPEKPVSKESKKEVIASEKKQLEEHIEQLDQSPNLNYYVDENKNDRDAIPELSLRLPSVPGKEKNNSNVSNESNEPPKANTFDLSQEVTNQRMKLLQSQHKFGRPVPKAPIKPGKSISNPFAHTEQNSSVSTKETEQTEQNSNTQQKSSEQSIHLERLEQEKEKVSPVKGEASKAENDNDTEIKKTNASSSNHSPNKDQTSNESLKHELDKKTLVEELKQHSGTKNKSASREKVVKSVPFVQTNHNESRVSHENGDQNPDVPKPLEENQVQVQEMKVPKTAVEYSFFSKKLNRDYKIKSTDLFEVDESE